jgi:hypothetical protein
MSVKTSGNPEQDRRADSAPAPPELVVRAEALMRAYPECFWFWRSDARIVCLEDVRLVVRHLREYGGRRAWQDAQDLYRCLLPLSKKKS